MEKSRRRLRDEGKTPEEAKRIRLRENSNERNRQKRLKGFLSELHGVLPTASKNMSMFEILHTAIEHIRHLKKLIVTQESAVKHEETIQRKLLETLHQLKHRQEQQQQQQTLHHHQQQLQQGQQQREQQQQQTQEQQQLEEDQQLQNQTQRSRQKQQQQQQKQTQKEQQQLQESAIQKRGAKYRQYYLKNVHQFQQHTGKPQHEQQHNQQQIIFHKENAATQHEETRQPPTVYTFPRDHQWHPQQHHQQQWGNIVPLEEQLRKYEDVREQLLRRIIKHHQEYYQNLLHQPEPSLSLQPQSQNQERHLLHDQEDVLSPATSASFDGMYPPPYHQSEDINDDVRHFLTMDDSQDNLSLPSSSR